MCAATMPSPASTKSHRRGHPSSIDLSASATSYATNGYGQSPPQSPRSPGLSGPPSPVTPRQQNSHSENRSARMSVDYAAAEDAGAGGLGSLADELADAWGEEEGYEDASGVEENGQVDSHHLDDADLRDDVYSSDDAGTLSPDRNTLHLPKQRTKSSRHRRQESQYDGSDYGNDSDLEESAEISPSLEARMAGIESLARRGTEDNGSENDHIIKRLIESLRDLGGQAGIENGATRSVYGSGRMHSRGFGCITSAAALHVHVHDSCLQYRC